MKHVLIFSIVIAGIFASFGFAQSPVSTKQEGAPLEKFLNPDGTIKLDGKFKGSLDVKGWRMTTDKNGKPRFEREKQGVSSTTADPFDEFWSANFGLNGINGDVRAFAVIGTDLYVGGSFRFAGNVLASNIAKWDGSNWSALGTGTNYLIRSLAVIGSDLYAGGVFTVAGGVSANNIAKWDGSNWSALGSGLNSYCNVLVVIGTELYAGGSFTSAGGAINTSSIAKWNGTSWSDVGGGLTHEVWTLAVIGPDLFVGGAFPTAGGVTVNYLAKWNGANWSALGSGLSGYPFSLTVSGTDLYAGGYFSNAGGVIVNNIAKWNGAMWSALGTGVNGHVGTLVANGPDLYAGGDFTIAGGVATNYIAHWNGSTWSTLSTGVDQYPFALALIGSNLVVGGGFRKAGDLCIPHIAQWNGSAWAPVSEDTPHKGFDGDVSALMTDGSSLYAGGGFKNAGGVCCNGIAKWDGTNWSPLGSGLVGAVTALAMLGTDLYAGGMFEYNSDSMGYLAKWDGYSWSMVGKNEGGMVYSLAVFGTDLIVGGEALTIPGVTIPGTDKDYYNYIARWDGSSWSAVGTGIGSSSEGGPVYALAVIGSDLYAGGDFTYPTSYIAKFDGTSWSSVGCGGVGGMNGTVFALTTNGTDLYAGGAFSMADNIAAHNIAVLRDGCWSPLGMEGGGSEVEGSNGPILALAFDGTYLYAGGNFNRLYNLKSVVCDNIGRWDGYQWSSLGSGISGSFVTSLAVCGSFLYCGGLFFLAGEHVSSNIASWALSSSESGWANLGSGVYRPEGFPEVHAIAMIGSDLYVGGEFLVAGGIIVNNIAKWNGSSWSALGSGMTGYYDSLLESWPIVNALAVIGNDLYVGGDFASAGGVSAKCIAKWDGANWSPLGTGFSYPVYSLVTMGTDLYAGWKNGILKWDGVTWSNLGSGISNIGDFAQVNALVVNGTDLYVGGKFTSAGGIPVNNIAKWDGSSWSALSSGVLGIVYSLAVVGNDLYVGGFLLSAGGVSVKSIAKWNGNTWSALGSDLGDNSLILVFALEVVGNDLYVGGLFETAGGETVNSVAVWNGSNWSGLEAGLLDIASGERGIAEVIKMFDSYLYVGGYFTKAGSVLASSIARWTLTSIPGWSSIASGTNGVVSALAIEGSNLYIGGYFTLAGGVNARNIAKWDGANWSLLGSGINGLGVGALAVSGSNVYAGGLFDTAGGVSVQNIAKWNGTSWSPLGSGVNDEVFALLVAGSNIYVGGAFNEAGELSANYIARWNGTNWYPIGDGLDGEVRAITTDGTNIYAGGSFDLAGITEVNNVAKWDGSNWSALGSGVDDAGDVNALAVIGTDLYVGGSFLQIGGVAANYIARWDGDSWSALGSGFDDEVLALAINSSKLYAGGVFTEAGGVSASHIAKWDGIKWSALGEGLDDDVRALASSGTNLYAGGDFLKTGASFAALSSNVKSSGRGIEQTLAASASHIAKWVGSTLAVVSMNSMWNLVSLPVEPLNDSVNVLYPERSSSAFDYSSISGYQEQTIMKPGSGYWLKSSIPCEVIIGGEPVLIDTIPVVEGWNLIGSLGIPINAGNISSDSGDIITSEFFTYANSYFISDSILPGYGYWVKVNKSARLILSTSGLINPANKIRITHIDELPPPPPGDNYTSSQGKIPEYFNVVQNYPNPFNPVTTIRYELPVDSRVMVSVFNTLGQEIERLVDEEQPAGYKSVEWNADRYASGVFFYRISAQSLSTTDHRNFVDVKKMILVK